MHSTLPDLQEVAKSINSDWNRGLPCNNHPRTRDKWTDSRLKDLPTHIKYHCQALGREKPEEITSQDLGDEKLMLTRQYLTLQGKGADVVANTIRALVLLRELAAELGDVIYVPSRPKRPERKTSTLTTVINGKRVMKGKTPYGTWKKYGFSRRQWSAQLLAEMGDIENFFTNRLARHRNKRVVSPAYMEGWKNRAERAFGHLVHEKGVDPATLSFRLLIEMPFIESFRESLHRKRGNRDTTATDGDVFQWQHLAANFYKDKAKADEIAAYRKLIDPEVVKDKADLVRTVKSEDLYDLAKATVDEAASYEADLKRKYDRKDAEAMSAYWWHVAGVVCYLVSTWHRERNVVEATVDNLFYRDGYWQFSYSREMMKSKRPRNGQVVDLLGGPEFQASVNFVLKKCEEVRPSLLRRFRAENPGKPEPTEFFLNMRGKGFSKSGLRILINSLSKRYLGLKKRISPHHIRTIQATGLALRGGQGCLLTMQHYLDHAHYATTEKFYNWIKSVFSEAMVKEQMDQQERQKKAVADLGRMPEEVYGILASFIAEIKEELRGVAGAAEALNRVETRRLGGRDAG
ncbi:MAG: hypothetical protein FJZ01_16065 [Candidatus Sericytochromatia bacterium]|nr:hypothetical protein [Candidatus Tanganyikabacteria bacterium]